MTKLKITYRKISELKANPKNARVHSEHQIQQLVDIIREVGFNVPISLDATDMIIAGHGRLAAAERLGMKEVPTVDLRHLSERQVRAYALADNRIALSSTWDFEVLSKELAALVEDDFDISMIGFNEQELDALLKNDVDILPDDFNKPETITVASYERSAVKTGLTEDNYTPEEPEIPITKTGDVWILGNHRLMCGDCTNPDDIARLMVTDIARLMVTDPPYGVAYVGKTKDALVIQNDSLSEEQTHLLWKNSLDAFWPFMEKGGSIYATVPAGPLHIGFANELKIREALRQIMVWDKKSLVLGHSDYHYRHEPILYGWKPGASHYFINDRTKTTVFEFQKPNASRLHPTMKPVELWVEFILNSSKENDIVGDMFGGSGTTIISCEKTDRRARVIEIDPIYCDVIVKRWQEFTGGKAIHNDTAVLFDEVIRG